MKNEIFSSFNSNDDFGNKGNNLKILYNMFKDESNVVVPETLVLNAELYNQILLDNSLDNMSSFDKIEIKDKYKREILDEIRKKFKNDKLVIRSSASCEDSIFFSSSGQYDSFLNISEDDEIIDAIRKVYASFHSSNSKLYSKVYDIDLNKETMYVLIQKVSPVIKSGVMFSCNPITGEDKYIIESTGGLGTNVVEGIGDINNFEISKKNIDKIEDKVILRLIKCLELIKKELKLDVDIEWGIDKDNNIHLFQARPLVKQKDYNVDIKYPKKSIISSCEAISKGFSIGMISDYSNSLLYNINNRELSIDKILNCNGIVLETNSKLSHTANITRELSKTCVFCKEPLEKEKIYVIDGLNNVIVDYRKLNSEKQLEVLFTYFNYIKEIEKHNQKVLSAHQDNKYEQVIFDINEDEIIKLLKKNGFQKKDINQSIYTYDLESNDLINSGGILRIQSNNDETRIQLKRLNQSNDEYRYEEGVILEFINLTDAKDFMNSLGMTNTGKQERRIVSYVKDDITVNIIKWPNSISYIGIEVKDVNSLKTVHRLLNIEDKEKFSYGGKEIFKKLNLTLNDCSFKEEGEVKCRKKRL